MSNYVKIRETLRPLRFLPTLIVCMVAGGSIMELLNLIGYVEISPQLAVLLHIIKD